MRQWFILEVERLLHLLFPPACAACGETLLEGENCLCLSCLADLPRTQFHREAENPVSRIFWGRAPIFRATSLFFFTKGSKYQRMMHCFKYDGGKEIGLILGQALGHDLSSVPDFSDIQAVLPVPLHPGKQKKRGYNQSEWIAKGVAHGLQTRVETRALLRVRASETQTRKSRFDRWTNVKDIFSLGETAHTLENAHLLLVDDVLTTGATLEACVHVLEEIPGVRISIATLATA